MAFKDELGMDEEKILELGAGFAAGMGCMESTCGALIGAVMVRGVKSGGQGTPRLAREMLEKFREKTGAVLCKDLKGRDTGKVLCPCEECVRNAVMLIGE